MTMTRTPKLRIGAAATETDPTLVSRALGLLREAAL